MTEDRDPVADFTPPVRQLPHGAPSSRCVLLRMPEHAEPRRDGDGNFGVSATNLPAVARGMRLARCDDMSTKRTSIPGVARQTVSIVALFVGTMSLSGCVTATEAATERARSELDCSSVVAEKRPELSDVTYEASGCGRSVRYTCTQARGVIRPVCVPEPPPNIEVAQ
jgi:hypothetical protein